VSRGALFLVGGKDGRNEDRVLIDRFARLCGGAAASVLVITSASQEPERHRREYSAAFLESGVFRVSIFHAEGRPAAEDPELLASLDRADGVYFTGGGQRRLVGAMRGTRFDERLRARHREGLHVGGTSAGASAMSAVMIAEGDGDAVELATGFGLLEQIIVDQHLRQRVRLSRLITAVLRNPAMLGFGLDEGTAVEIDAAGNAEVRGAGGLTIVDGSRLVDSRPAATNGSARPLAFAGMRLHVLTEGWRYDLAAREAMPPGPESAG
jgi:cyanophycinase